MTTDAAQVVERWIQALTDHDLEAAVSCFAPDYRDSAPARRGEEVIGNAQVRANFAALFASIPDLRAELLGRVADGRTVWMEWRMNGTRSDGTPMEFIGINIFEVEGGQFTKGRIYTELVRDSGGLDRQIDRMTRG
ncbi:MAG: nuclear transport factor 2 family protein [Sinomonas sp.]|jgi:limonene-1,2-epoxide hydrolase|nr:nuclear transport factor 2 family protein [Sinomonas sp.]